jgi:hypothetical protein
MLRVRSRSNEIVETYSFLENKMPGLQELFANFASTESTPDQSVGLQSSPNNKTCFADKNTETESYSANFCYMQWRCPQSSVMSLKWRKLSLGTDFQPSSLPQNIALKLMLKPHREVNRVDSAVNSTSAGIHLIWNWILCIECIVPCHAKCAATLCSTKIKRPDISYVPLRQ